MYNMDPDKLPKRAVVSSQAGAENELRNWLRDNQFESLTDADGLDWQLDLKVTQVAAPQDPKGLLWQIRLGLRRDVDGAELLAAGILQRPADDRLVDLIGEEVISLTMKPQLFEAANELEAKRIVADALPRLKADLAKKSLIDTKRSLVGRWVDQASRFGGMAHLDGQEPESR